MNTSNKNNNNTSQYPVLNHNNSQSMVQTPNTGVRSSSKGRQRKNRKNEKKKKKKTPQELDEEQELKEEFFLDLQEAYDKIHDTLQDLVQFKQIVADQLTPEEKKEFRKKMHQQIKETNKLIDSLDDYPLDPKFDFMEEQSPMIIYEFKKSMSYLLDLMNNLYKIEKDTKELDKLKIKEKLSLQSHNLQQEINNSKRRVMRTKAGIRLDKVIHEQLEKQNKNIEQVKYNSKKDMGQILDEDDQEKSQYDYNKNQRSSRALKESNLFLQKQQKIEEDINKLIEIEKKGGVKFDNKYEYLFSYFQKKFSLINLYLGENKLRGFIQKKEEERNDEFKSNRFMQGKQDKIKKTNKQPDINLELLEQLQQNDKQMGAMAKLIKINEEIKEELAEEEHKKIIREIHKLDIQSNQKQWNKQMALSNKQQGIPVQSFKNKRPLVKTQDLTPIPNNNVPISRSSSKPHNMGFTELDLQKIAQSKNKKLYMNSHPSNPLISNMYQDFNQKYQYQQSEAIDEVDFYEQGDFSQDDQQIINNLQFKDKKFNQYSNNHLKNCEGGQEQHPFTVKLLNDNKNNLQLQDSMKQSNKFQQDLANQLIDNNFSKNQKIEQRKQINTKTKYNENQDFKKTFESNFFYKNKNENVKNSTQYAGKSFMKIASQKMTNTLHPRQSYKSQDLAQKEIYEFWKEKQNIDAKPKYINKFTEISKIINPKTTKSGVGNQQKSKTQQNFFRKSSMDQDKNLIQNNIIQNTLKSSNTLNLQKEKFPKLDEQMMKELKEQEQQLYFPENVDTLIKYSGTHWTNKF